MGWRIGLLSLIPQVRVSHIIINYTVYLRVQEGTARLGVVNNSEYIGEPFYDGQNNNPVKQIRNQQTVFYVFFLSKKIEEPLVCLRKTCKKIKLEAI